jgi:hypothetical protein
MGSRLDLPPDAGIRSSVLGGDVARRGILALAPRSRASRTVGLSIVALVILLLLSAATLAAGLVCVVLIALAAWLVWPPAHSDRSRLDRWIVRRQRRFRHARGLDCYTRPGELRHGSNGAWELPPPVGRVEPLDLAGTEWARLFILHHLPTGSGQFLTVLMATDGLGAGLWTDAEHAAKQEGFGALLSSIAKEGRWLSDIGQLSRTLPQDFTQHTAVLEAQLRPPPEPAPATVRAAYRHLLASYDQVVQQEAYRCEEHRNYLVARIDVTDAFQLYAARFAPGPAGWAKLVRDELLQLTTRAASAGLGHVEVLGEQRTVAALRALQNPDCPPDRHGGLTWADAFVSFRTTQTELVVDEHSNAGRSGWYTRVAAVPLRGMEAAQLGPRWLAPVLVDLSPAVVRTVATRVRPVPARSARVEAVKDATTDTSATVTADAEGKVDDGTGRAMVDASSRRLLDLAPGSGHAGAEWAMFIALQAPSKSALDDASRALDEAAADASIFQLDWLEHEQDLAWPAVLALGRGVRA